VKCGKTAGKEPDEMATKLKRPSRKKPFRGVKNARVLPTLRLPLPIRSFPRQTDAAADS
jgi:hypothetical protein